MISKIGGPGWDRTNDQPIMSPHEVRPTESVDINPNSKRPRTSPMRPLWSGWFHPIGSQDWQSNPRTK